MKGILVDKMHTTSIKLCYFFLLLLTAEMLLIYNKRKENDQSNEIKDFKVQTTEHQNLEKEKLRLIKTWTRTQLLKWSTRSKSSRGTAIRVRHPRVGKMDPGERWTHPRVGKIRTLGCPGCGIPGDGVGKRTRELLRCVLAILFRQHRLLAKKIQNRPEQSLCYSYHRFLSFRRHRTRGLQRQWSTPDILANPLRFAVSCEVSWSHHELELFLSLWRTLCVVVVHKIYISLLNKIWCNNSFKDQRLNKKIKSKNLPPPPPYSSRNFRKKIEISIKQTGKNFSSCCFSWIYFSI